MIDGIITVRSQSTRLPEKCFLPFGDSSVIEYVIRRAKYFDIDPLYTYTGKKIDLQAFACK